MSKNYSETANLGRAFSTPMVSRRAMLRSFVFGVTAVGASLVAGCAAPPAGSGAPEAGEGDAGAAPASEVVSLELWHPYLNHPYEELWNGMETLVNQVDPSVQTTFSSFSSQEFFGNIKTALAGGNAPHIAYFTSIRPADELVRDLGEGIVQPLDDFMVEVGVDLDDFHPNVLDPNRFDGKLLGIPLDAQPIGAVINRTHAEAAGKDLHNPPLDRDSFLQWAEAITNNEGHPAFVLDGAGFQTNMVFGILATQFGEKGFLSSDAAPIDTFEQAARFIQELYSAGLVHEEAENLFDRFLEGKGSIYWTGPWVLSTMPEESYFTARVPTIGAQVSTLGSVSALSILKSENALESAQTIARLSDLSGDWVSRGPGVPPRGSLVEQVLNEHPLRAPFIESIPFMDASLCGWDMYINAESPVRQGMDLVWRGEVSLEEQLQVLSVPDSVAFGPCCRWGIKWCCRL